MAVYIIILSCRLDMKIDDMKSIFATAAVLSPAPRGRMPERGYNYATNVLKPFEYSEYNPGAPTYTIISHQHRKLIELMENIKLHKINYVLIDAAYFTQNELVEICKHYKIKTHPEPEIKPRFICGVGGAVQFEKQNVEFPPPMHLYNNALVFLEDKEYIGGIFEMYETIFRSNENY